MNDLIITEQTARGGCPMCQQTIPFRANFRRGRTFVCRRCGAQLSTRRAVASAGIAVFFLLNLAERYVPVFAILLLLALAILLEWLTAKVHLVAPAAEARALS
jgi:hypothetical protein